MDPSFVRTDGFSEHKESKPKREGFRKTLSSLRYNNEKPFPMKQLEGQALQNMTMSKLSGQKNSLERAYIEVEKMDGSRSKYWEKQTSVAHFAKDG